MYVLLVIRFACSFVYLVEVREDIPLGFGILILSCGFWHWMFAVWVRLMSAVSRQCTTGSLQMFQRHEIEIYWVDEFIY